MSNSSSLRPKSLPNCLSAAEVGIKFDLPQFPSNLLIFDYFGITQQFVTLILQKYSKIRDIHSLPPYYTALIHVSNIVAEATNTTLFATSGINACPEVMDSLKHFPAVAPVRLPEHIFLIPKQTEVSSKPNYASIIELSHNFAYCDRPRQTYGKYSMIDLFLSTSHLPVWLCLAASIFLISLTINIVIERGEGQPRRVIRARGPVMLAALSVLLSPGISGQTRGTKRSFLFVLWMYTCVIYVTYYSGELTSDIIGPTRDVQINTLEELINSNYSFVFETPARLATAKLFVTAPPGMNHTESSLHHLNAKFRELLKTAIVATSPSNFVEVLATRCKYATFAAWTAAIFSFNQAKEYIEWKGIKNRHCYIGKILSYRKPSFFIFYGPDNYRFSEVFKRFLGGGFYEVWWNEHVGIGTSSRVQDRSKLISPTQTVEDSQEARPLSLQGKTKNIFVVWSFCLGGCFVVVMLELFVSQISGRWKQYCLIHKWAHF